MAFYQRQITGEALNPENPGIAEAADKIFALLSKEYERAPENERMKAYFPITSLWTVYITIICFGLYGSITVVILIGAISKSFFSIRTTWNLLMRINPMKNR